MISNFLKHQGVPRLYLKSCVATKLEFVGVQVTAMFHISTAYQEGKTIFPQKLEPTKSLRRVQLLPSADTYTRPKEQNLKK